MASRNQSRRRSPSPHAMATGKQMADRLLYGLVKAIGRKAVVSLNSGLRISGILYTIGEFSSDGNFSVCLKFPLDETPAAANDHKVEIFDSEYLLIPNKDILMIRIRNVDFTTVEKNEIYSGESDGVRSDESNGFKTDSAISSEHHTFQPHALKKWVPDDGLVDQTLDSLELNTSKSSGGHWDQFKANEEKFNIHSTFDESLYTTKISKDSPDFQRRFKEAERIAHEIESQGTHGNVHLAEERGLRVDDSGLDEEDKYSGVLRDQSPTNRKGKDLISDKQKDNRRPSAHPDEDKILMGMLKSNKQKSISSIKPVQAGRYATPRQRAAYYHKDPAVIYSSAVTNLPAKPIKKVAAEESASTSNNPEINNDAVPKSAPVVSSSSKNQEKPKAASANVSNKNEAGTLANSGSKPLSKHQSDIAALKEFSAHLKIPENVPGDILPLISKARMQRQKADSKGREKMVEAKPQQTAKKVNNKGATNVGEKSSSFKQEETKTSHDGQKLQKEHQDGVHSESVITKVKTNSTKIGKVANMTNLPMKNNTDTRYGQAQQNRHRKSPASFFGAGKVPSDTSKAKRSLLEGKFSLLVSAKMEYEQQSKDNEKNSATGAILIVQIERPFTTTPTWPSTVAESYKSTFSLQPEWVPAPPMGRKLFMPSQTIPMMAPQSIPPPIIMPSGGPPRMMEINPLSPQQTSQQFAYGRRGSSASRRNNSQSSSPSMQNVPPQSPVQPVQAVQPALPHIPQQAQQPKSRQQGQQPVQTQQLPTASVNAPPPQPMHMQSPNQMSGMQMGAVPQYQFVYQQPQFIPMYTPNPMAINGAQPMSFYPGMPPPMMPGSGGMMPRRNSRNRGGHYPRQ